MFKALLNWVTSNLMAVRSHAQRGFVKVSSLLATLLASVGLMAVTAKAYATSLLPADALTGVQTDAIDTIKDIVAEMIPIVVGIMVAWSVISFVKKGFGKAGIK